MTKALWEEPEDRLAQSAVSQAFSASSFDCLQYAKTGGGEGLGTRLSGVFTG